MALEDSKYLTKTIIFKKYKKWVAGIDALDSKIQKLEEKKAAIDEKINDDIEETPAELIELHAQLFNIDKEIESAKELLINTGAHSIHFDRNKRGIRCGEKRDGKINDKHGQG